MREHVDQKDLHLVCSQTKDMNMKQNVFIIAFSQH